MQPFRRYFQDRMQDAGFKAFYDRECHVCAKTVQIFAHAEEKGMSLALLAESVGVGLEDLEALRDADRCDPAMVIHLCRHLGLPAPESCPRHKGK